MPPKKNTVKQQSKTQEDSGVNNLSATLNAMHSDDDESAPTQRAAEDTAQPRSTMSAQPSQQNGTSANAPVLTAAERAEIEEDLKKTEDEIETLRQVLQARIRHANELKHKLGMTPWTELQNDIYAGWRSVRDSNAIHKTEDALKNTGQAVKSKISDMKNSDTFQSLSAKFTSTAANVKSKIGSSMSMYGGFPSTTPTDGTEPAKEPQLK